MHIITISVFNAKAAEGDNCACCKFAEPETKGENVVRMRCRRYPPLQVRNGDDEQPETEPSAWCGEWAAASGGGALPLL